jgi:hypothetical protein
MQLIAPGIHRWTAPHPIWRTSVEEVISYGLANDHVLALVDPQLPAHDDPRRAPLLAELDQLVHGVRTLELLITIPYHTRSTETLYERYWSTVTTRIWGHRDVKKRLTRHAPLELIPSAEPGGAAEIADGMVLAFAIGHPRRNETPMYFPALKAVVFGDSVVGTADGLRFWNQRGSTSPSWYREVFAETLRPLLERDIQHVLVTHGTPPEQDGQRALEECLATEPVRMY